jgi:hypothetical protein
MHRTLVAGFATAARLSSGLNVAVTGLAPGTAQADPMCSPSNANTPPCAPPEAPRANATLTAFAASCGAPVRGCAEYRTWT